MNQEKPVRKPNFIPLAKWIDFHPWPTTAGLRHLWFYRKKNGFDGVGIKVGTRVLIDEEAFFSIG